MKSSRDCQTIIDITIQILVGGVCLIPKYDSLRYPETLPLNRWRARMSSKAG